MQARKTFLAEFLARVDGVSPPKRLPKHVKMATSPFVFFRGSSQLFYKDIHSGLIDIPQSLCDIPKTTIIGDCHTSNFGFLTEEGSHGDSVIFSPNDYDDACIGHAVWDLLRYCTSLRLCVSHCRGRVEGRIAGDKEVAGKPAVETAQADTAITAFLQAYLATCTESLTADEFYLRAIQSLPDTHIVSKRYQKALRRAAGGAEFDTGSSLAKAVDLSSLPLRFRDRKDRFEAVNGQLREQFRSTFAPYVDDQILDLVARLNAGTGSVNLERYYLLVGPAVPLPRSPQLYHVVEVKQQRAAAPLYFFDDLSPNNRLNPAHLTVMCQRRMQRRPDLVLDEVEWQGKHWLVRSRHHAKVGIDPEHIAIGKKARKGGFEDYAALCGRALAIAHCRGDRRSTLFEQAVVEVLPDGFDALRQLSDDYARQVQADTGLLRELLVAD
ncbi:DUF2252 family protein [Pseudomaricurvus alkylphenolicus]|uniref:DUF2252 family protein n=1 Tax=Pseudomaricurvus alkylphenolicus TaxID=1306991 RepID=UPI00141DEE3F|nr:DUF2252 family protein [Pseudomaricurvus alkylphenolicus]NIB39203.1 DUF2252 family protein [Pseudomaricurvus alkylphenolicus]